MTQIDELEKLRWPLNTDDDVLAMHVNGMLDRCINVIKSSAHPKIMSREEFERVKCGIVPLMDRLIRHERGDKGCEFVTTEEMSKAFLATIGITVEGE